MITRRLRGTIEEGGGSLSRNIAPSLETLEEVKLQTSLYDAATGRNGGGNFQLVSKSGTNNIHGTIYHFLQNDKLIANDFFFNRAGRIDPSLDGTKVEVQLVARSSRIRPSFSDPTNLPAPELHSSMRQATRSACRRTSPMTARMQGLTGLRQPSGIRMRMGR